MHSKNSEAPTALTVEASNLPVNLQEKTNMNSVQNNSLTFQQTAFHPVLHAGETWLTSSELASALGYKKSDAVTQIFSRYHDEFTDKMSTTLKMSVVRKTGVVDIPVRVFSLRGAHLVAMFATTPKAKEFRRWVLDILDREVAAGNVPSKFDFQMYVHNANVAVMHMEVIRQAWREELFPGLKKMGSPLATRLEDRIKDAGSIICGIRGALERASGHSGLQYK